MAQGVKNLGSTPGTHIMEEENRLPKVASDLTCMVHMCFSPNIHTHTKQIKFKIKLAGCGRVIKGVRHHCPMEAHSKVAWLGWNSVTGAQSPGFSSLH